MKELYISPEVKLIGFVSSERIANLDLDFSDFANIRLAADNASVAPGDIKIPVA